MDELTSMDTRDVFDEMTPFQLTEKYWSKGIRTKTIPAHIVTVRNPT